MPILKKAEELSFQVVVHAIYDLDYLILSNYSACKPISMYLFIEKDTNRLLQVQCEQCGIKKKKTIPLFFEEKISFNLFLCYK